LQNWTQRSPKVKSEVAPDLKMTFRDIYKLYCMQVSCFHIKIFDTFTVILQKKITENNTAFQTMHRNFPTLWFMEMGLRLSESLMSCASSVVQHFVLRPMEERGENLVPRIYASRYKIVDVKETLFFLCFVIYLCGMIN